MTDRDEALRAIEGEIGVLLRRVKRAVAERGRAVHPDLHPITYLTLSYVVERGPVRASDIVEQFAVDKGAVSRQVQQLQDLGLVERAPDPDDGRASLIAATPDALRRIDEVSRARRERFDDRLRDWSDAEVTSYAADLRRYNAALTDLVVPDTSPGSTSDPASK